MKSLLSAVVLVAALSGCASTPYVKVGVGYKVAETNLFHKGERVNDPISARMELGMETETITYGISHHSQYFSGFPFNNDHEYSKTELFVDYKIKL